MRRAPLPRTNRLTISLGISVLIAGCGMPEDGASEDVETAQSALTGDSFPNAVGASRVVSVNGAAIDENNPFFQNLGTNGRRCVTCHQPSAAMTITPPQIQQAFNASQGLDPLFRLNDGANGPLAKVSTLAERQQAYSLLLNKGLIRIGFNLPASRDFDVKVVLDPYAGTGANPPVNQTVGATATPMVSFYRRPLLSANTRFIAGSRAFLRGCWEERDLARLFLEGDGPPGFDQVSRKRFREWVKRAGGLLRAADTHLLGEPFTLVLTTVIAAAGREVAQQPDEEAAMSYADDVLILLSRLGRS